MDIRVGLSLMHSEDFRRATESLFKSGAVEVLEWSFDTGWGGVLPPWTEALICEFSDQGRLLGHGVTFSVLSAQWTARQETWLGQLALETSRRQYRHVSEHFGFMAGGDFHQGAPLPVPLCEETLRVGREGLARLAAACHLPVGFENLAFAFGPRDVADQGRFIEQLLAPVDGFLLLDLHNIYCQACNFDVSGEKLIDSYPLDRVRELHVSGGSWSDVSAELGGGRIRRDTHDGPLPRDVLPLVRHALANCPHVEAVIFERLGGTIVPQDDDALRTDFLRLREEVAAA